MVEKMTLIVIAYRSFHQLTVIRFFILKKHFQQSKRSTCCVGSSLLFSKKRVCVTRGKKLITVSLSKLMHVNMLAHRKSFDIELLKIRPTNTDNVGGVKSHAELQSFCHLGFPAAGISRCYECPL